MCMPKAKIPAPAPAPEPVVPKVAPVLSKNNDTEQGNTKSTGKGLKRFQIDLGDSSSGSGINTPL